MTTTTADTAPISCYLLDNPPRSAGRVLLARVLEEFVAIEWGIGPDDLASYFGPEGFESEDDRYVANCIRNACGAIVDLILAKRLHTYARPLGGGLPVALDPGLWEIDDARTRFATSTIALQTPFDLMVARTHWIFVDTGDLDEITTLLCGGSPFDVGSPVGRAPASMSDSAPHGDGTVVPQGNLLRQVEVTARTGMSRSTMYAKIERGDFPEPLRLGSRFSRWREGDVDDWIRQPR